jgi:myo-inositol-1-phosphate synthase
LIELAKITQTPIAGKDFKTGQTLMKTILAPGLAARSLGVNGWFSTNILGNRDGLVLDDPDNFKTKEVSKLGVLEDILNQKTTLSFTAISSTKYVSTTIRRTAITKKAGITLTFLAG